MRLTLRTLLAYMDDILDPADQEELGRKIEASDFATELIHRSRDAARRLKLGAPPVIAESADDIHGGDDELDPNRMAEYLDNTLSPEAVGDFERACLAPGDKGDMLLAEASSCHHILAMVLGEPADVDPDLRERAYAIGAVEGEATPVEAVRAETPPVREAAPVREETRREAPAPARTAAGKTPQIDSAPTPEVPDYLRVAAQARRRRQMAIYGVLAAMLGGIVVFLAWPKEQQLISDISEKQAEEYENLGQDDVVVPPTFDQEAANSDAANMPSSVTDDKAAESAAADSTDASPSPDSGAASAATAREAQPSTESQPAGPAAAEAPDGGALVVPPAEESTTGEPTADEEQTAAAAAANLAPVTEKPVIDDQAAASSSSRPALPSLGNDLPKEDEQAAADERPMTPDEGMTDDSPADGAPADEEAADDSPIDDGGKLQPKPRPAGAFLGVMPNEVLLGLDPLAQDWVRLKPGLPLEAGAQLLTLPTFQALLNMGGANLAVRGGTKLEIIPVAGGGGGGVDFALGVDRGRLVVSAPGAGSHFQLFLGDRQFDVELDPNAMLAFEVSGLFKPGRNPANRSLPRSVHWYMESEKGRITGGDGAPVELSEKTDWTYAPDDQSAPVEYSVGPAWIFAEQVSDTQKRGQVAVLAALKSRLGIRISLQEVLNSKEAERQREIRILAAECAAEAGIFEPLVAALNDEEQESAWDRIINEMRSILATDPDALPAIREAVDKQHEDPAETAVVMEMLMGYDPGQLGETPQEIEKGPIGALLTWMNDDDRDIRVLAFRNVRDLTGLGALGQYSPLQDADRRTKALQSWYKRLDEGTLLKRPG